MALGGNLVLQMANNPGTSTFNLIAPPTGRTSFVAACSIGQVYYIASDPASWEIGVGTIATGSPDTLSRDTVLSNSLGTTAKINFTGQVLLTNETPAERDIWASADNSAVLIGNRRLSDVLTAQASGDAPRLDQVGNVRKPTISVAGGALLIPIPQLISGDTSQIVQIDLRAVTCAGNAPYYFRLSTDGAATFLSGNGEYKYSLFNVADGTNAENNGFASYVPLTAQLGGNSATFGTLEFDPVTHQWASTIKGVSATTGRYQHNFAAGNSITNVPPTHLVISAVGQLLTGGQAHVSQKGF